jgi:two-component system sensor histidine kinase/response regulator
MMYLVYSQYRVQEKLQKSFLELNLQESEKKSLAIGYFLSERVYDLSTLAGSRELSLYYENKALGMSLEYGLGATINAAQEMLNRFRGKRMIDGHPIFERLIFAETSGNILFESSEGEVFDGYHPRPPLSRVQHANHAEFSWEKIGNNEYLIISFPFLFKGRLTGRVTGWIPVELICGHFIETAGTGNPEFSFLAFRKRYLFGKHDVSALLPPGSLPDPEVLRPGAIRTISVPSRGPSPNRILAFTTPVSNTPLALVSFRHAGSEESGKPPRRLFYVLVGIGLALLAGGIAFNRVSMRSAVLEARLDETRLREKIVEEKNNSLRKLLTALEQSSSSVVITDVNGTIEYVNPHFCRVTGYTAQEAVGENSRFLKSGKEPLEKYRDMWETVLSGKSWSGEFLNRKKNGELYWEQANIAPVIDEHGVISSLIAIKEDSTERKLAEQELRRAKDAAEAASRAKSDFLANMSHEIRTPLNGVIGMTELCLSTNLGEEQRLYLTSVRESAANLLDIINDILDFSKIESGKTDVDSSAFLLRTALGQALRPLAARAAKKGIALLFNPSPETPDALVGDPGKLKQVIVNLVGNAVKFTERGQILVSVSTAAEDRDGCILLFTVQDTGIGIPLERREIIFEPFEQGDISTSKSYGGTGLGLAISKKLVELMGGSIKVSSEEGTGSTFTFTARFAINRTPEPLHHAVSLNGRKALIVDDTVINRRVISDFLEQWGVVAYQAENTAQAHEFLRESLKDSNHLDFLLVDVQMPGCDGWQFVREIRNNRVFDSIRCILMPSLGLMGDSWKCRQMGIDGYLPKPIVYSELHELLCTLLSGESRKEPGKLPVTRHTVMENRNRLSILVAEDVPVNQELIRAILVRYGHVITVVDTGVKVVEAWHNGAGKYDLILMDVQMPLMDGLQAARRIREMEKPEGTHIPIVAMTAYAMKGDRDRCLEAGMDEYISKPFRVEEIGALLEGYVVKEVAASVPLESGPSEIKCASADIDENSSLIFNRPALLARIGGNEDMVNKVVSMFVSLVEETLPILERTINDGDGERARITLHSLKGAAANIGAERMHDLVTALYVSAKRGDAGCLADSMSNLRKEHEKFKGTACVMAGGF